MAVSGANKFDQLLARWYHAVTKKTRTDLRRVPLPERVHIFGQHLPFKNVVYLFRKKVEAHFSDQGPQPLRDAHSAGIGIKRKFRHAARQAHFEHV